LAKYNLIDEIKDTEMSRACNMTDRKNVYRKPVVKPEERSLKRPRPKLTNNIKMNLRMVRWGGMDCINLAEDRDRCWALVNTVMNLRIS
jgi:hypothetical protein